MSSNVKILRNFKKPDTVGKHHLLLCLTGVNKGTSYIIENDRVTMGRADEADIVIKDIKSSRIHAELKRVGPDLYLTDLKSHNGIMVNDLKIKQHKLASNDKVIIGQTIYKYSRVDIDEPTKIFTREEAAQTLNSGETKKDKKLNLTLLIITLLAVLVFLIPDEEPKGPKARTTERVKIQDIDDSYTQALLKKKKKSDQELKKKLSVIFQRGLRELREKNFFRAIAEFERALALSPNDPLGDFYLQKAKDALNQEIETLFINASRDYQAIKYEGALVSYCGIIRLLYNYPEDERYKNAKERIKDLEGKLGLDEGEVNCIKQ